MCFWSVWLLHHVLSNALFLCSHWSRNGPSVEGTGVKARRATQRSSSPGETPLDSAQPVQLLAADPNKATPPFTPTLLVSHWGRRQGRSQRELLQTSAARSLHSTAYLLRLLFCAGFISPLVVSQNIAKTSHNRQTKQQGELVSGKTGSDEGKNWRSCIAVPSVD